ncbi:hypothetical protein DFJ73DRAFT_601374, partial [Zopfochytrium polystomum]
SRVVLYLHGNAGHRATFLRPAFYKALTALAPPRRPAAGTAAARSNPSDGVDGGTHVVAVEYRGFGDSSSALPTQAGLQLDALAAYAYVAERVGPRTEIYIAGHSLGAGVAAFLAHNLTAA